MDKRSERFKKYLSNVEFVTKLNQLSASQKQELEQLLASMSSEPIEKYKPSDAELESLQLFTTKIVSIAPKLLDVVPLDANSDDFAQFTLFLTWLAWATDCCLNILDGDGMPELDSDVGNALLAGKDREHEPAAMQH